MGNMYISFSKMPILFFIYLEKIVNIRRKYRKNDEYFPHSEYHHSIAPNELDGNSIRRTHTQGLVYKRYNNRFKSTVNIIISTKYSWNLTYIQILRYRKKYQLKALKTYKGHLPFYICCYNHYQKTITPRTTTRKK